MRKHTGFSLIELFVVIVIVGLLLGTTMKSVTAFIHSSQIRNAKEAVDNIKKSINGFVLVNGRLPCPDNNGDGDEDCAFEYGFVPYLVLGVDRTDPWGNPYMYAVDGVYSDVPPIGCHATFLLTEDEGIIEIEDATALIMTGVVALVYSLGPNGVSEQVPAKINTFRFISKPFSPENSNDPFDDIVTSISSLILKAEMVQSQQLPEDPAVCPAPPGP